MNKYAVIVAGGTGTRMGNHLPKQFILLKGKPVLYYTLKTFLTAYPELQVILVLPSGYITTGQEIIEKYFKNDRVHIVEGGPTRFQSVKNGLALVQQESIVFVHDAVRCLLSIDLVHRCYEKALASGSAVPVVPSNDSVRLLNGESNQAVDRNKVMLIQTPQTFQSSILLRAFRTGYHEKFTDEATVVEANGEPVFLVEGEETNIKITRPVDLFVAEKLLDERESQPPV